MTFIDSNVPMYLVGANHPHRTDARRILEGLIASNERLVCDAEVLQEILHRYTAVDRREAIGPAFDLLLSLVDEVFPIEREDVQRARQIVSGKGSHSARDAIHLAVMERYGIRAIFTFDKDYDRWPGLTRIWQP